MIDIRKTIKGDTEITTKPKSTDELINTAFETLIQLACLLLSLGTMVGTIYVTYLIEGAIYKFLFFFLVGLPLVTFTGIVAKWRGEKTLKRLKGK